MNRWETKHGTMIVELYFASGSVTVAEGLTFHLNIASSRKSIFLLCYHFASAEQLRRSLNLVYTDMLEIESVRPTIRTLQMNSKITLLQRSPQECIHRHGDHLLDITFHV